MHTGSDTSMGLGGNARSRVALLGAGLLAAVAMIAAGYVFFDRDLLFKYPPDLSPAGLVRTVVAALVALLFYSSLRPEPELKRNAKPEGVERGLILLLCLCMAASLIASAVAVLAIPASISGFVREGMPLSVLTEVGFIVALVFLGRSAFLARSLRAPRFLGVLPKSLLAAAFGVALLVLMEEMSWGQHWLGWQAGEMFAANEQNETNLHNFATHRFEAVYYTIAFFLFVVLSWVWPRKPHALIAPLTMFVPPRAFALAGVALAGLWYDDWNIVPYQIWFVLGLLIVAQLSIELTGPWRMVSAAMIALVASTQIVFLVYGDGMKDGHELSEVREFLIALLVAAYAILLHARVKTLSGARTAQ